MRPPQRQLRVLATLLTLLIASPALLPHAAAERNPVRGDIAHPTPGATFARGEPIRFVDATTTTDECPLVEWTWRFDDGNSATGREVTHAYASKGSYDASVHIVGECGRRHAAGVVVHIVNALPVARLDARLADDGALVLDASASTDGDGAIATYRFFLDGALVAQQAAPVLRLAAPAPGEHEAAVVVLDDEGAQGEPASRRFVVPDPADDEGRAPEGIDGGAPLPQPLARIVIEGPTTLPAGATATYALRGEDAQGEPVALARSSLEHTAPTRVGTTTVTYEEQGVTGSLDVAVVAGPLAAITLTGPASLVAGTTADYALAGQDAHANPVALTRASLAYTAPTRAGPTQACHQEQGVEGCLGVLVVPDALAAMGLTGPDAVPAREVARFEAHGTDRHGNVVTLRQPTLEWTAPATRGPARACHEEDGVTACRDVLVVSARPVRLELVPAAPQTNPGRDLPLRAVAYDADGAVIDDAPLAWTTTLGTVAKDGTFRSDRTGTATLTVRSFDLAATATVRVTKHLQVALELREERVLRESAEERGVSGSVLVRHADGAPAPGALVTITVTRSAGNLRFASEVHAGETTVRTDENGFARFHVPLPAALPGEHRVDAHALLRGNEGTAGARYQVRAA